MWFNPAKPAAALCLYALLLLNMPLPPTCPLPQGDETVRYTGREIRQPVIASLRFAASVGRRPACFGSIETVTGFGWTRATAEVLQKHSYLVFSRQRFAIGVLLLGGSALPLLWQLFRHYRNRRHTVAGHERDST